MSIEIDFSKSSIEEVSFCGHQFFIKRDDLLHENFSGNKARKFLYYLEHTPQNITHLVSHGSNQSNAMYSLSALAKLKNWHFTYYCEPIPNYLKQSPNGNFLMALQNGMNIIEGTIPLAFDKNTLFIPQGGAFQEASYGIELLAKELTNWQQTKSEECKFFLPSGTGTTALFLQKYLKSEVLTTPCVGDSDYLKKQFLELETNEKLHPTILPPPKKFHFGKLYKENFTMHNALLEQTRIEFDLLYDPIGWQVIIEYKKKNPNVTIVYIHQGGLLGNITMKERYLRKYSSDKSANHP